MVKCSICQFRLSHNQCSLQLHIHQNASQIMFPQGFRKMHALSDGYKVIRFYCNCCYNKGLFIQSFISYHGDPTALTNQTFSDKGQSKYHEEKKIFQQTITMLQNQNNNLRESLTNKQAINLSLQKELLFFKNIISEKQFEKLVETEKYYKQLEHSLKEAKQIYIDLEDQLSYSIELQINDILDDYMTKTIKKLENLKKYYEIDREKLENIKNQTIKRLEDSLKYDDEENLFDDEEIKSCIKIFNNKLKQIQSNIQPIDNFIHIGLVIKGKQKTQMQIIQKSNKSFQSKNTIFQQSKQLSQTIKQCVNITPEIALQIQQSNTTKKTDAQDSKQNLQEEDKNPNEQILN